MEASSQDWYIDSGASNHMTCNSTWFASKQPLSTSQDVITGDNSRHPITHIGQVPVTLQDSSITGLKEVLCVPSIARNLISMGQLVDQNYDVIFNQKGCLIKSFSTQKSLLREASMVECLR